VDAEEARTIGWRLWRVRDDRGKSLRVIAGLAGMSKDTLNRIERGERSPTLSEIRALADALQISVSELTRLPVPAPANGHTDSTIAAVDLALMAVSHDLPDGSTWYVHNTTNSPTCGRTKPPASSPWSGPVGVQGGGLYRRLTAVVPCGATLDVGGQMG
jgi:transcriptional regulator with XRE-family HTH domain